MTDRLAPARLLRLPEAARYCGVSVAHFQALTRDGRLPPGHLLTERVRVWDVRALDACIDALLYGSPEPEEEAREEWA